MFQSEDIVPHAHNEFLEILSETGLLGFITFLFLLFVVIVQIWKHINDDNPKRTLMIGVLCAIISILIDNLFSLNLRTVPVAIGFWILVGSSHQQDSKSFFSRTIQLPAFFSKIQSLPFILLIFLFWWLIPKSFAEYKTERTILEGNILTWKNDERKATEKFKEAVSLDSTHYFARYYLAANLLKQSQHTEARNVAQRLLQDYPYAPKTNLIIAIASFELGDTSQAMEAIQKELEIESSPQPYYYYAYFVSYTGNKEREVELLETMFHQIIKGKSPDLAAPGIERLTTLVNDNNREQCLTMFRLLGETFSSDGTILITLAEGYFRLNEFTVAKQILERLSTTQIGKTQLRNIIENLKNRLQTNQPSL
jgi:tetratricopeptide (TPR) repeat protein